MAKRGIPTPALTPTFAEIAGRRADEYRRLTAARSKYAPTPDGNPYFVDRFNRLCVATLAGPVVLADYADIPHKAAG